MVKEFYPCCACCEFASTAHVIGTYTHCQPCNRHQPDLFRAYQERPDQIYKSHPKKKGLTYVDFMNIGQVAETSDRAFFANVKLLRDAIKEK